VTAPAPAPVVEIPEVALVVLVGVSGAGKSTFARRVFAPTQVISSDFCRGLVADDENDQSATRDAFEVLYYIAGKRLAAGRLTVVDATNLRPEARAGLVELARSHDVLPVAIVLDIAERVCAERNRERPDRDLPRHVLRRQRDQLRRALRLLPREGFRHVQVLGSPEEVAAATVRLRPLRTDLRAQTGPFDVIGDVHGCRAELEELLGKLGYVVEADAAGQPIAAHHPAGRRVVFLGDLVDRGPDTPGVLRLAMGMAASGTALVVPGNHEQKLLRALRGQPVQLSHGRAESLAQLARQPAEFCTAVVAFLDGLVSHYVLDGGQLVVAHAGLIQAYHNRSSRRVREFALYGQTTGETDEYGLPVRYPWAAEYRGRATVLYGHTPVPEPVWLNNTLCLDTGCVFGGRLSALRYPEREIVSVPAGQVWYEPARPLAAPAPGPADAVDPAVPPGQAESSPPAAPVRGRSTALAGDEFGGASDEPGGEGSGAAAAVIVGLEPAAPGWSGAAAGRREPGVLDIRDALGVRLVETVHRGRITVREENAAAALEVMGRFAIDPRWLLYLPPTMAPAATSRHPDLLEHPAEAFAGYRAEGVTRVVCEEKHMGSRAVLLVCRDAAAARARFGVADGSTGAVHTRTGRPFFDPATTEELLARLRAAISAAGLWDELATGWLLLDAELLPWSVKAGDLIRHQYAAVGAAARAALPATLDVLDQVAGRGLDVTELTARTRRRTENAARFSAAYRRYCWPTTGLVGVRVAPFQLLAADGAAFADRDHEWHLSMAGRLAAAAPDLVSATRHQVVDFADPVAEPVTTAWWEDLTGAGGEGMVVKPWSGLARGPRGLVQPGVKCRGREYLRIIYGPDYLEPANLSRLRERNLARKRSLALREYALGVEALERAAGGEPLWRVHECVFAVLALESEPVDPRL
jgi:protein phosphatase